ncbi:MAG: peptidase T [Flavobacteriaceae bacterium]
MMEFKNAVDRFITYARIYTESDPNNPAFPSTENQWDLAHHLVNELKEIGLSEVELDENCYVTATLPSNVDYEVPTIGFVSHIDTSPDFTGKDVKPQIHRNYDGKDIVLNKEKGIVLDSNYFDDIQQYVGQDIITTDGTTLLGADDKAGITEIVTAMEYLLEHPNIKHGRIRICFTPDEEVGKGAHKFDVEKFGAQWAYTMDGSEIGELEYENFNAASALVEIQGKIVHPGYAKGKMINAITLANKFVARMPQSEVPEMTTGYEGFFHLHTFEGKVDESSLNYIIRDHDKDLFEERKKLMLKIANDMNEELGQNLIEVIIKDQYFNMKEKIEPVMHIVDLAKQAMEDAGIQPNIKAIRGGTDGSQLSYMGLPCPNIFAGGHNFHGRFEYLPIPSLLKATEVIVRLAEKTAKHYA